DQRGDHDDEEHASDDCPDGSRNHDLPPEGAPALAPASGSRSRPEILDPEPGAECNQVCTGCPQEEVTMTPGREVFVAVSAAFLMMSFAYGCSRDLPTSASHVGAQRQVGGPPPPSSGSVDFALLSDATSFIRRLPEMDMVDGGGVWGDMQSTYF